METTESGDFSVERRVGRLLEIRARALRSPADVERMIALIGGEAGRLPASERVVIAADYRAVDVLTPAVAAKFVEMLGRFNPRVERSILLVGENKAIARLQLSRLLQEAQGAPRRTCRTAAEAHAFLGEVLSPAERERLAAFLDA